MFKFQESAPSRGKLNIPLSNSTMTKLSMYKVKMMTNQCYIKKTKLSMI